MGLCTNRVLMGQLLALFISAKRQGSDPAPLGSASNDKRKERAARLLTAAGTSRRLEVGQTMSALPRVSQASRRRRTLKCDEHRIRFFLSQEMRRLACIPTKNENRNLEGRSDIRENGTTDGFAGRAVTRRD